MVGGSNVRRKSLDKRGHGADLTRILNALVDVSQGNLGSRCHPPCQINGCLLLAFMYRLSLPTFLIIQIGAELQIVREITCAPDEEIDAVGAHAMAEWKPILPHAIGKAPVVVPNAGQVVACFSAGVIRIRIFDPEVCGVPGKHLWNIDTGQKGGATWNGNLAPFIFRTKFSIDLQSRWKRNQIGNMRDPGFEVDHGLFITICHAGLIRRILVAIYRRSWE